LAEQRSAQSGVLARIPHSGFFVSAREEPRVRRAGDAVVVLLGIVTLFIATVQSERSGPFDRAVVDLVDSLPSWSEDAFAIGYGLSAIYALGVIGAALVGGRRRLYATRDLVLAVAIAVGLALIHVRSIEGEWPVLLPELGGATTPQIPVARVATVTASLSRLLLTCLDQCGGWDGLWCSSWRFQEWVSDWPWLRMRWARWGWEWRPEAL
jgi:hypothetical protein